ncbi:CRAL/TRIO domain-containing protein [Trametopsis cervina]|nr:CRAL/TRIO domain-containing protein [Trametopsis cervina]
MSETDVAQPPVEASTEATGATEVPKEAVEPQNELTKQFTDAEWAALKEFREKLPAIYRAAYAPADEAAEPKTFNLWGIDINPTAPAQDARVSVVLMKFLRARELRVSDAETMLVATLRWREEFKINELLNEEFPQDVFGGIGHVFGHDKDGRPVTYNLYGGGIDMTPVFSDVKRFIRWRVQLMEKTVRTLDYEKYDQMVQVHDYAGVNFLGGRDANQKAAASEATKIFQDYYPEFLSTKFFINVPTFAAWIFWFFKSLLSSKTFAKMSVVGPGEKTVKAALIPVIDVKELPKRYGGEADAF